MKQNTNDEIQNSPASSSQQQAGSTAGAGRKHLLYIVGALIAVAVILLLLFYYSPSGPSAQITQNKSANSTSIYMSASQVEGLLGPSLGNYQTSDLFDSTNPLNASFMAYIVPQLYGNLTSGWLTAAYSTNTTSNSSIYYIVMTTNSTPEISKAVGSSLDYFVNMTPAVSVNPGTSNGLNYTYGIYSNSTVTFQILYGWKNRNVALVIVAENTGSTVNETKLIGTVANDTP